MTALSGIIPAAVTPFDANGVFAPGACEQLLGRVYAAGVDGIYVCGTTGEGMQQPARQRKAVAETAVRLTPPGRHVIVHVGAASLAEAIDLAQHAARAGAHAVSSLPPLVGRFSFAEIREYYRTLAAAAELPVLIYYFPELSSDVTRVEQIAELCDLPNVVGVKFSDFDLYRMWSLRRDGRSIFNGRDEVLAAGLLMGADGGIGSFYNLVPDLFVQVYRRAVAGDWAEARAVQEEINRLIRVVLRYPLFPAIKQILAWSGIDCGACLPPRKPLTPDERRDLHLALARSGLAERLAVPAGPSAPAP